MRRYAEKRLQEEKGLRDLVQQVAEGHKNSKAAREKLQKFKQSIGRPTASVLSNLTVSFSFSSISRNFHSERSGGAKTRAPSSCAGRSTSRAQPKV